MRYLNRSNYLSLALFSFIPSSSIIVNALSFTASSTAKISSTKLAMSSEGGAGGSSTADVANFALRQSPSTTQFVTNKMCPYAQKAWIALEASNAPYEMEEISLYGTNGKPDWFLELNPEGTVPVLTCFGGAVILPDSDLILDFIADGAVEGGSSLKPKSDDEKMAIQKWRDVLSKQIIPVGKAAVLRGKTKELYNLLAKLNSDVTESNKFLCGDTPSIADCAVFPFLWRIDQEFGPLTEDNHKCGNVRSWLDTCCETDAFKKTVQSSWWWWW